MRYRTRASAAQFLTDQIDGRTFTASALSNLAYKKKGPRHRIINGVACYTDADLLAWLEQEATKPVTRRRRGGSADSNASQPSA